MSAPLNSRRALLFAVTCVVSGAPNGEAFGEQISVSWQTTDHRTAIDGDKVTREGTATFANGETAHMVMNIIHHSIPGEGGMTGSSATTVSVYRFDDGSAFTLRFVGIWNSIIARYAGIFGEGNGRFAGITGSATGGGESPGSGPVTVVWTGTYELPKK